ncbi:response regulator transcription factor [Finegoldia magna]|uniref:response regulator transcription factor n=1 Tax=Finegoldia magna TaxID=1260 RepID=UPI0004ACFFE6|nr:response regulator [Finegoldia magna]
MTYKIMIVDDQFVSREMFRLNINQCSDYEVVYSVDTAMFADTYVLNKKIDLVIMDILMKDGSNGLDAAEKIKN